MALPKKGIRKITVDNVKYYYTVSLEYYGMSIQVAIGLVNNPNKRFYFSAPQYDEFLKKEKGDELDIGTITPKLVAEAIKLANKETNWKEEKEAFHVQFAENKFSLIKH